MILYTIHESSEPSSFRHYFFLHFNLKTYFVCPRNLLLQTNWNGLNNLDRVTHRDHSCEVWSKSNEWFQRRSRLNENVYARAYALTDDGQRTVTINEKGGIKFNVIEQPSCT